MAGAALVQAVILGWVFFFTFAAYDTIQVFAKTTYRGNIGTDMTMCIYVVFTVCCLPAPAVVNKLGSRLSMFLGILGYSSVVIAGLVYFKIRHSRNLMLAAGCVLGVGAALLWTGQGRLILDYSNDTNRGQLFSVFWALYRSASLMGGILSFTYFSVEGNDAASTSLYFIFLALMLTGALGTFALKNPEAVPGSSACANLNASEAEGKKLSWIQEGIETLRMFGTSHMLLLAVMFFASGSNEPYALSTFTRFFSNSAKGMEMVFFYSGSVVGAFFCGRLLDMASKRKDSQSIFDASVKLVILFSTIHAGAFVCAAIVELKPGGWAQSEDLSNPSIFLPSLTFLLWGLSDSMINTFLYWLIGELYPDGARKARGVGVFKLLNSGAHVLGYGMCNSNSGVSGFGQLLVNIVLYAAGVAGTLLLLRQLQAQSRSCENAEVDTSALLSKGDGYGEPAE